MTGPLTRVIATLAFLLIFAGWTCAAAPARAESPEATTEGSSAKAAETAGTPAPGLVPLSPEGKIYTGEKISLEFTDAELHNIVRILGEVSGKNIILSETVNGKKKVTLKLRDMPWDQALDIVLSARNLGVYESDDALTVYDLPTLESIRAGKERLAAERAGRGSDMPPLAKKVITVKHGPIDQITADLNKLKSKRGTIMTIDKYIYIADEPKVIAAMTQFFMRIDPVPRQILIEARIIEVSPSTPEFLDLKWNASGVKFSEPTKEADTSGETELKVNEATLAYDFIDKKNALFINANLMPDDGTCASQTISGPRIMAAHGQKVSIRQGQQRCRGPLAQPNTSHAANVRYNDILMELEVTPYLEENGQLLTLDLKLINGTPELAPPVAEPAINIREAGTKLLIKDGETIVIGGLITDNDQGFEGRPADERNLSLSDWLSPYHANSNEDTELLILVTATIIPIDI